MYYNSKMHFELSKSVGFLSEACVEVNDGSIIDASVEHKFQITVTNTRTTKLFKLIPWTFKHKTVYFGNDYEWFLFNDRKRLKIVSDTLSIFAFREIVEEWKTLNP